MEVSDVQIPTLRSISNTKAIAAILVASGAVFGFLIWLIYFKPTAQTTSDIIAHLPAANAFFNSLSAIFLILAYRFVRRRQYSLHIKFIFAALISSTLFLVSYVIYHNYQGDTKFLGQGFIRPIYFFILISHIVLSGVVVPLILTSLYLSLSGRLATHKRVSRVTFPIWLYVSVTGVLIFGMLKAYN